MGRKRNKHRIIDGVEHKRCSKCKEWLILGNFYKNKSCWDGLTTYCKKCTIGDNKRWRQSKRGKEIQRKYYKKYRKTKKYEESQKKYRVSKKGKEAHRKGNRKYLQSKKGRKYYKEYRRKFEIKNRNNVRAKTSYNLGSVSNYPCLMCDKQAEEYHHFTYDEHYKVNTVTLCKDCHNLIHKKFKKICYFVIPEAIDERG